MIKWLFTFLICLVVSITAKAQYDYRLFGYITDEETGEPIVGARINLPDWQTETYTNNFGYFSISVPPQDFFVLYSVDGFKTIIDSVFIEEDIQVDIKLKKTVVDETLMNDLKKSQSDIANPVSGKIDVPTGLLKELPYILSEPDLIKGLQSLPGITSGNDFFSNLYVRGGGADQNLILLDGAPVYNGTHLFGLFSIFQPDITNSIQVYKAGFPARYGGRASSVIDISSNEGTLKEPYGSATIGLLIAKLSVQGPIGKNHKTTYSFGIRRSYWDMFSLLQPNEGGGSNLFVISDYNFKLKHKLGKYDIVYFSIYAGRDRYPRQYSDSTFKNRTVIKYGNASSTMRWNHIFNPKLFSNISISATRYKVNFNVAQTYFDSASQQSKKSTFDYNNGIGDISVNGDFEYSLNNNHTLHFGLQNTFHFINPGYSVSKTSDNADSPEESGRKYWGYSPEIAAYVEDEIKVNSKIKLNIGLRAVYFSNKTYNYNKIFIEPRFSGRYLLRPDLAVKASYSRMNQNVFLLSNSGIGIPFNFWVPATNSVPTQSSNHFNLGLAKELKNGYRLAADAYFKTITNVLFAKEDPAFFDNALDWQTILEKGKANGYGMELLIQKNSGYLTGWFGYTLAYANRKFDNLNLGRQFQFSYNRRHTMNVVMNYRISEGNSIFATLTLASGRYFTIPGGKYRDIDGNDILDYSALNNFKGPFFQRLDLGVIFNRHKADHIFDHQLYLTLYNALLAKNPLNIFVEYVPSTTNPNQGSYKVKKSSVPYFIPGISYILKF